VSLDVVVVGAGAMGAATAWQAAKLGADVTLLDRGQVCGGTSAHGVGLVTRLLWEPPDIGLVAHSLDRFRELDEAAGSSFDYHDTGSLLIVGPEHEGEVQKVFRTWRAQAIDVRPVSPGDVADIPGCGNLELAKAEHAFFTEADGWCVTTDAVRAMVDEARSHGADVRPNTPVDRVRDGLVHLEDGDELEAEAVVVAAGVRSRQLIEDGWRPPIDAFRAQAAVLGHEGNRSGPIVHDTPNRTYWRPEGSGQVMIGDGTDLSSHEPGLEPSVDESFAHRVAERLRDRWPAADPIHEVRSWADLETATPDARPLVGRVPDRERVYLCTGGNGFGFMRSPALGEGLAQRIVQKGSPVPLHGCEPSRFEEGYGTGFPMQEGFALD
jgi:glycine/D-amino acid oxidase-like deaminating enzyme